MSGWQKEEIREQLDDLGAYRREVEGERAEAEVALNTARKAIRASLATLVTEDERFSELERELDQRLAKIYQSTAVWSHRAAEAGIPESEVLERLSLGRGPAEGPEEWEFES